MNPAHEKRDAALDGWWLPYHGRGIRETGGLDDDVIEAIPALHEFAQDADQVAADRATDAPVVHLHDLFLRLHNEPVVNANLAELVLDDGNALAVVGSQDVVDREEGSAAASHR